MDVLEATQINSFASVAQQAKVSPEEPIFVLTSNQIQDVIAEATKSLNSRVEALEDRIIKLDEKIAALEATQDTQAENQLIQLRLINDLRKDKEPQPLQKDRGEILKVLIAASGGKMLAKDARKKMHLSKATFSVLLSTMKDYIETQPCHLNRSAKVLVLRV